MDTIICVNPKAYFFHRTLQFNTSVKLEFDTDVHC